MNACMAEVACLRAEIDGLRDEIDALRVWVREVGTIDPDIAYTHGEAATIVGITPSCLKRWCRSGNGPAITRFYTNAPPRYLGRDIQRALERSVEGPRP
ncbi:hypothetical protein [Ruegeria sp. Alg231-54]|uniref:hypothetical protein n=1 Tax=Ruegeria sp. Alg231-54 TaxID=1922221 RepID=UPI000D551048|nr:hypothetical protein [Ruegeria sp. Alg231-54]